MDEGTRGVRGPQTDASRTEGVGKGEGVERRVVFAGILPTHLSKVTSTRYMRPLIGVVMYVLPPPPPPVV